MTPLLELRDVRKSYDVRQGLSRRAVVRAVDGVTLTVEAGETLGLVGESGCGKSTLSRLLVHLETADSGEIRFRGEPLPTRPSRKSRRNIQMVFQDPYSSLPPHFRVRDVIGDPLVIHGDASGAELRSRVDELITSVGLPADVADKYPRQLSGGQRQRVGIARALALRPPLLVADEAVSALDVSVQAQILNLLKGLQRDLGLTMLFVSHDIGVVTYLSTRVAVMYLGRIVETGPAQQVYREPAHPYTRALMAAVPSLDRRGREYTEVRGEAPDPKNPPGGCPFNPRCPMAQDICRQEAPPLQETWPGRQVACHFAAESLAEQVAGTTSEQP